jgi:hypothetical protein
MVVPLPPPPKPTQLEEHDDIPLQPLATPQRMPPQAKPNPAVVSAPYTNQVPPSKPPAAPKAAKQTSATPAADDEFNLSAPVEVPKYRSLSAESAHLEGMLEQTGKPQTTPPPVEVPKSGASAAAAQVVPGMSAVQPRRPWTDVMRGQTATPPSAETTAARARSAQQPGESRLAWLERHPFTLGIIPVFRQTQVFARWMSVTLLMVAQLAMLWSVLKHLTATGEDDADIGAEHILGLFMLMAMLLSMIPSLMALSSFSLAIFEDTANGSKEINSWPAFNLMEWAQGSMYFLGALGVSGLPGFLVGLFMYGYYNAPIDISLLFFLPVLYLSWYLFFPIVFISMLETGTILEPFSPSILPSMLPLKFPWLAFYGTSFIVSFGSLVCLVPMLYFGYTSENFFMGLPLLIPSAFIITAFPLIYFRFVGKIALIYREYMGTVEIEEEDEEEPLDMKAAALRSAAAAKRN